jgi:hypothetical protein
MAGPPAADLPPAREKHGSGRGGKRKGERAAQQSEQQAELVWDEDTPWGWVQPESLSLSAATNAFLGAAIGGVVGGAIWVVAVAVTGFSLPYLTVVVGLLAGLGARFALVQTRPRILGLFGAAGAALAYLMTQYGLLDYALAQAQIRQGLFTTWFPLSPLRFPQVYIDYVIGVSDDVTHALGLSGEHPLEFGLLLACMAVCWAMLLRRKK